MAIGRLPEDGELRIGSLALPAGRRITAGYGSGGPVAWVTTQPVPDAGRMWAALSSVRSETRLVPFLLAGLDETAARPWDEGEFEDPADITRLGQMDAASLLAGLWEGKTRGVAGEDEEEAFKQHIQRTFGPFSRQFPGLAPASEERLDDGQVHGVLAALPAARIGLVPAARPADVLPLIGWSGTANWFPDALPVAAVLRSWEHRFGARLLHVGFAKISLLVQRPPLTVEAAQRLAAEQVVFCDACQGRSDVRSIAASLVNAPIWTFWWD